MTPIEESTQNSSSAQSKESLSDAAKFLLALKSSGNINIGIQSLLDALDLWISSLKYYFDAMNPASTSMSTKMFLSWLRTEEGVLVFLSGAIFFGAFAYLGNGIKKEDQTELSQTADNYWPYVRDVIKRLKWTFKGNRSLLLVAQKLFHEDYVSYITPFGVLFGLFGAANQLWNRSMVETRKALQESNDLFRRQVKAINACYLEIDEKFTKDGVEYRADAFKNFYAGSLLKVIKAPQYYYLSIDKNGKPTKIELEASHKGASIEDVEEKDIKRGDDYNQHYLASKYPGRLLKVKFIPVYYLIIDDTGAAELLDLETGFTEDQQNILKTFLQKLNDKLNALGKDVSHSPRVYWNNYYALLNEEDAKPEFQEIPNNPFKKILEDKTKFIQNDVLNQQSPVHQYLLNHAKFQDSSFQSYASATLNGVLNAPYYFLGVLSMVPLPSNIFIYAVGICCAFMGLNILSEVYQESDYQRRLKVSQLKANMVMNKRLLVTEWLNLHRELGNNETFIKSEIAKLATLGFVDKDSNFLQIINKFSEDSGERPEDYTLEQLNEIQLDEAEYTRDALQEKLFRTLIRIENFERSFIKNHQELKPLLRLSELNVWWQAIRNGLVVYGAFNSLLMTVATMSALFNVMITPIFFYFSITIGILILALTTAYTVFFINPSLEKNEENEEHTNALGLNTSEQKAFVAKSTTQLLNCPEIQVSTNLLIPEHAEVFRQSLSGIKKGIKCIQTIMPSEHMTLGLMGFYLSASISYAYFFAMKGLRGLIRVENEAYKNSFMYCAIAGKSPSTPTKIRLSSKKSQQTFATTFMPKISSQNDMDSHSETGTSSPRNSF